MLFTVQVWEDAYSSFALYMKFTERSECMGIEMLTVLVAIASIASALMIYVFCAAARDYVSEPEAQDL